jgi:hypothetical protein
MTPLSRRVTRLETVATGAATIRVYHRPDDLEGEALDEWERANLPPPDVPGLAVIIRQFGNQPEPTQDPPQIEDGH